MHDAKARLDLRGFFRSVRNELPSSPPTSKIYWRIVRILARRKAEDAVRLPPDKDDNAVAREKPQQDPYKFGIGGLLVCYRHLGKKPCAGCLCDDENKPGFCRACKIRECARGHGVIHCFSCGEFPCKRLRTLDKSYRNRYGVSLVEYGRAAAQGVEEFLRKHTARYT